MLPEPRRPTEKDCAARGVAVIAIAPTTILKVVFISRKNERVNAETVREALLIPVQRSRYVRRHNSLLGHRGSLRLLRATHGESEPEEQRRRRHVAEAARRRTG